MRQINPKYAEPRLADLVAAENEFQRKYFKDGMMLLDAGCGDGRTSFALIDDLGVKPKRVIMFDINADCIREARRNIKADPATADLFEAVEGSIFEPPFKDQTFDGVASFGDVLSLAGDGTIEKSLRQIHRVLKPDGILVFSLVTKEYLLKVAEERGMDQMARQIHALGIFTEWNQNPGEGVYKSWCHPNRQEDKLQKLGFQLLERRDVVVDYPDIPARTLFAARATT